MKPFLFAVLPLLALAACTPDIPPNIPGTQTPMVLQQTQELYEFLPGRTDIGAEITDAKITGVAGQLILNKKTHVLTVEFKTGFSATNGPANNGAPVTLPYFVAVTQGDDVLQEQHDQITLNFESGANLAVGTSKTVKLKFLSHRDYPPVQVLVGFDMTPDQLRYAQAQAGTP